VRFRAVPAARVTFVAAKVTKTAFPGARAAKRGFPAPFLRCGVVLTGHPAPIAQARPPWHRPCGLPLLSPVLGSRYGWGSNLWNGRFRPKADIE